jgi:integrase
MTSHHPENEAVKRDYLLWLENAGGRHVATADQVAAALARFERHTGWKDFKTFSPEQAIGFKAGLMKSTSASGGPLAKATVVSLLRQLRAFFEWLSREPGYRRAVKFSDAAYFRPTDNDARIASARRQRPYPSVEQVHAAIAAMPAATVFQRRDRAVVALSLLTGGRDGAIASLELGHLDIAAQTIFFDARTVRTKARKTFKCRFYPVGGDALEIITAWEHELRLEHLFGPADPLFPATLCGVGASGAFGPVGLSREPWASADPIRAIFKSAFAAAGLPYFNPHSLRKTLVAKMYAMNLTTRGLVAWSQNLGHKNFQTTVGSYGQLSEEEQVEAIAGIGSRTAQGTDDTPVTRADMEELLARLGLLPE